MMMRITQVVSGSSITYRKRIGLKDFYLGTDPSQAMLLAGRLKEIYIRNFRSWQGIAEPMAMAVGIERNIFLGIVGGKPATASVAAVGEAVVADAQPITHTATADAITSYLAYLEKKLATKGSRKPQGVLRNAASILRTRLAAYRTTADIDLSALVIKTKKSNRSVRTQKNIIVELKRFSQWLGLAWDEDFDVLPKVSQPAENVPTLAKLAGIYRRTTCGRVKDCLCVMLNCGFTQIEIATLGNATISGGVMTKEREKEPGLHGQWQLHAETLAAVGRLKKMKLIPGGIYKMMRPALQPHDNSDSKVNISIKMIRKAGATWIENHFDEKTADLYLARRVTGVNAVYIQKAFASGFKAQQAMMKAFFSA